MLNDKQRKQIIEMYSDGEKVEVIAMIVGCRNDEVSKTAINAGMRRHARFKNIKQRDDDIAKDYIAGVKVAEIAKKYGLEQTNIYRALKRHGVTERRCKSVSRKLTPHDTSTAVQMYQMSKMTMAELAASFNVSVGCLTGIFRRLGVEPQRKKRAA